MNTNPHKTAKKVFVEKHSGANCLMLAGSVMRGESTPYSDLDVVILYDKVDCAYRESFILDGWPIETFIHDYSTLKYFCIKMDKEEGKPSLPQMILEGVVIPVETELSKQAKAFAKELIQSGPPILSEKDLKLKRYLMMIRLSKSLVGSQQVKRSGIICEISLPKTSNF